MTTRFRKNIFARTSTILLAAAIPFVVAGSASGEIEIHPGFEEGVRIGSGLVRSAISIGDVDQDFANEILVGGADGVLYAFNGDGSPVVPVHELDEPFEEEGFAKSLILDSTPGALFKTHDGSPIYGPSTLADLDADRRLDILWGTDGGSVFRLELRLTIDPIFEPDGEFRKNRMAAPSISRVRSVPVAGEDDDPGPSR